MALAYIAALFVLLVVLPSAFGTFRLPEIPGEYTKKAGFSACPTSVKLNAVAATVTQEHISLTGATCTSGSISFKESPAAADGNKFTGAMLQPPYASKVGGVVLGLVDSGLICPLQGKTQRISRRGKLNFLRPSESFTVDFGALYRGTSKSNALNETFTFEKGNRYLVLTFQCVYVKFRAVESESGDRSNKLWTWLGPVLGAVAAIIAAIISLYAGHCVHSRRQAEKLALANAAGTSPFSPSCDPSQHYSGASPHYSGTHPSGPPLAHSRFHSGQHAIYAGVPPMSPPSPQAPPAAAFQQPYFAGAHASGGAHVGGDAYTPAYAPQHAAAPAPHYVSPGYDSRQQGHSSHGSYHSGPPPMG